MGEEQFSNTMNQMWAQLQERPSRWDIWPNSHKPSSH